MKIKDYSYYKKNALNRYLLSKELSKHREVVKQEKAKKINDFVIPAFSATMSVSSAYFLKSLDILDNFFFLMGAVIALFISAYYLSIYAIEGIVYAYNFVSVRLPNSSHGNIEPDISSVVEYFNIDVVNQLLLSYTLIKESEDTKIEKRLKNFNVLESFFYLKDSTDKLNEDIFNKDNLKVIFTEHVNHIPIYRVKLVFDMIKEILVDIESSDFDKPEGFDNDFKLFKDIYENLMENLSAYT